MQAFVASIQSPFRRPTQDCAPVDAKAGCLYPNNARAVIEAQSRGFDNCLLRDALGNVAELATANVFLAKDGTVFTPTPNGTFLNGITRQRVTRLMQDAGVTVVEKDPHLCGFPGRRRDFLVRQFFQAHADHQDRRPPARARSVLPPSAPALLGIRARVRRIVNSE
jgi:hypothetical protein